MSLFDDIAKKITDATAGIVGDAAKGEATKFLQGVAGDFLGYGGIQGQLLAAIALTGNPSNGDVNITGISLQNPALSQTDLLSMPIPPKILDNLLSIQQAEFLAKVEADRQAAIRAQNLAELNAYKSQVDQGKLFIAHDVMNLHAADFSEATGNFSSPTPVKATAPATTVKKPWYLSPVFWAVSTLAMGGGAWFYVKKYG